MKQFFTLTSLFLCCSVFSQRSADLKVDITSPSSPFEVDTMEEFDLQISVANLGPDNITSDDSLFFYMTLNGEPVSFPPQGDYQVFQTNLASGGTYSITIPYTFSASFQSSEVDMCIIFQPVNADDPISDAAQTNNKSCIGVLVGSQVGLDESAMHPVVISPNPAKEKLTIACEGGITALLVSDYAGKAFLHEGAGSKVLDCSDWPAGLYYLTVVTDRGTAVEKVVVTR